MLNKRLYKKQEFYVSLVLVVVSLVIYLINPNFLSLDNIFSVLKSMIVPGILALGVLLVLISGGIDISFPAIAAFALYNTTVLLSKHFPESPLLLAFLIAALIGALCGFINGFLIAVYKLPTLVVTLGTGALISGFMYTFIGTKPVQVQNLPKSMLEFGKSHLVSKTLPDGATIGLPTAILIFLALCIILFCFLKFTLLGRKVYMLGGDENSADRLGINVLKVKFFIYIMVGILASIAGIIQVSFLRRADVFELYGSELLVIAAVVLGGANIGGGKGTVWGTIVGTLLIRVINNSLILVGVSSYWQKVVIGIVLLISVSFPLIIKKIIQKR